MDHVLEPFGCFPLFSLFACLSVLSHNISPPLWSHEGFQSAASDLDDGFKRGKKQGSTRFEPPTPILAPFSSLDTFWVRFGSQELLGGQLLLRGLGGTVINV